MDTPRHVEIEIKLRLESFTDYLKLIGFLGSIEAEKHHESGFFDSEDRQLAAAGWVLRVRAETDRGLITVKSAGSGEDGMAVIREEIEAEVDRGTALELLGGFAVLSELDVEPLRFLRRSFPDLRPIKILQFQNERQLKHFRMGDYDYLLEIDKTTFADGSVDYELEVEVPQQDQLETVQDRLRKIFDSLDIPFEKQSKSKFERALERA
ncbi:CYTH domain-containing protein [candidate division GN15 bacterium]|nr:CYTH domain-containing protein [candidate division GN15 bacterium]